MTTFEQAMLARDRTLAIRVGKYQSSDINEAAFSYGYIAGDTFKPGGTCAGSGKIIFSSIITTFKKLDKIYPEIGLLVNDTYEWVKMGEYFINDIKIDRNRSKTELELMDGMFKFNQPYVSDLSYPAQIRDVIREICKKTGVELQTENLGLRAIQQHIPKKPDKKDITFREVLSQAVQLLGFSAFFNREGKLEIRGLTESGITITADSYFLHGLTKSETEYQIAGITCKKTDKEVLTVGLRTGRSLELENSFMNQNILDDLYYDLKNLKYYPFSLNYQGHLKLQVGQWVTIKTNKNEIFKVPVLSQSFSFKGGLSSRISADSKAVSDTQYSYSGFIQRRINQVSTDMRAEVQQQLEWAEKEFDKKQKDLKDEIKTGIEQAKAKVEQVKSEINQSIEQKLQQTKSEVVEKVKQDFNQGLANANAEIGKVKQNLTNLQSSAEANIKQVKSDLAGIRTQQTTYEQNNEQNLARITQQMGDKASKTEVKQTADGIREEISQLSKNADEKISAAKTTFEKTAEGLKTDMTAVKSYVADDGKRREQLEKYSRKETARQIAAERSAVAQNYVAKSQYTEDVKGVNRRFEELTVGGVNLIRGAKNMVLASGKWNTGTFRPSGAGTAKPIDVTDSPVNGFSKGVRLTSNGEANTQIGITQDEFDCLANTYTISWWVKGKKGQKVRIQSYWWTDDDTGISPIMVLQDSNWIRIKFTSKRSKNGKTSIGYVYLMNGAKGDYLDVMAPQLDIGTFATANTEAPEDTQTKLAEYKQTVDGEFKKLQSSVGEMVKKTDINITPGQISFGTGKVVNGKTIASLFVQNPESIEAVTKLMRITGDLIVDGSITGRDLAANTITTAHLAAGAVTTEVLAADAVTAKKLRVDYALINKLTADDALLNNLVAKQAFINKLSTIDFSATQIKGGILKSLNNISTFDLQRGILRIIRGNGSAITLGREGLHLKKQEETILGLTYKEGSILSEFYSYNDKGSANFEIDNGSTLAISLNQSSSNFIEISPEKETVYISGGFKLYLGGGQNVSLEHTRGTFNGVDFSSFRALGTNRDELRFFRDGRIELYHKKY
ncbi:tail fiber domain-containing protein [Streptococcus anginosus]|uniref:tail fiber domain-containing protein n=1 Tax=Streptococcus anginosus TaxID=1328 RepID=UPI004042CD63